MGAWERRFTFTRRNAKGVPVHLFRPWPGYQQLTKHLGCKRLLDGSSLATLFQRNSTVSLRRTTNISLNYSSSPRRILYAACEFQTSALGSLRCPPHKPHPLRPLVRGCPPSLRLENHCILPVPPRRLCTGRRRVSAICRLDAHFPPPKFTSILRP